MLELRVENNRMNRKSDENSRLSVLIIVRIIIIITDLENVFKRNSGELCIRENWYSRTRRR